MESRRISMPSAQRKKSARTSGIWEEDDEGDEQIRLDLLNQREMAAGIARCPISIEDATHNTRKPTQQAYSRCIHSVEQRLVAFETLTLITCLLVAEALHECFEFDAENKAWTHPRFEIYIVLMIFAIMSNLYLSTVSLMVVVACKRVSSWDFNFEEIDDPKEVFEHADFQYVMKHIYGSRDKSKWLADDDLLESGGKVLKLPVQYHLLKKYIDGRCSATNIGVLMLPWGIMAHMVAFVLDFTKERSRLIHYIAGAFVIPCILIIFCTIRKLMSLIIN